MLKFSKANAKTRRLALVKGLSPYLQNKRKVFSLDLLSGHFCPFAKDCLSKAVMENGKRHIQDGPNTLFRCFSASQEVLYTQVYNQRSHNSELLRKSTDKEGLILSSLPANAGIIRIHVGGDFFNQDYFDAWLYVSLQRPDVLFYAYTKSLPYWIARLGQIPDNFVLTASKGGRKDELIDQYKLRKAVVVGSNYEAKKLGLPVDHDDSHAALPSNKDFALLIHGVQPKGSKLGKRVKKLGGYNRKDKI